MFQGRLSTANRGIEPFNPEPHKMIKHTQTIRRQKPTIFLRV